MNPDDTTPMVHLYEAARLRTNDGRHPRTCEHTPEDVHYNMTDHVFRCTCGREFDFWERI